MVGSNVRVRAEALPPAYAGGSDLVILTLTDHIENSHNPYKKREERLLAFLPNSRTTEIPYGIAVKFRLVTLPAGLMSCGANVYRLWVTVAV